MRHLTHFNYRLVVFDWDGTLADSVTVIVDSIIAAGHEVNRNIEPEAAKYIIGLGLESATAKLLPGVDDNPLHDRFMVAYKEQFRKNRHRVQLYEGALPILEYLKTKGKILAMATGKSRSGIDSALEQFMVSHLFDYTISAEEAKSKPDQAMLLELMRKANVTPRQTVMIGDTVHDLEMASRAGVDSIGVTYGAHPAQSLLEFSPACLVNSLPALKKIILDF